MSITFELPYKYHVEWRMTNNRSDGEYLDRTNWLDICSADMSDFEQMNVDNNLS